MTSGEAMQAFIDSRIAPDLQAHFPQIVAAYRAAWKAGINWNTKDILKKAVAVAMNV